MSALAFELGRHAANGASRPSRRQLRAWIADQQRDQQRQQDERDRAMQAQLDQRGHELRDAERYLLQCLYGLAGRPRQTFREFAGEVGITVETAQAIYIRARRKLSQSYAPEATYGPPATDGGIVIVRPNAPRRAHTSSGRPRVTTAKRQSTSRGDPDDPDPARGRRRDDVALAGVVG